MTRLGCWTAIAAALAGAAAVRPAQVRGQALYRTDAPREPGAKSWAIERARLPRFEPPRTADGRPDLNGRWAGTPGGDDLEEHPYVDISSPPEESFIADPPDGRLPYQPWALARRAEHRAGLARGWPGETGRPLYTDPQTHCFYSVPRATYRGGFELHQAPDHVLIAYTFAHYYRLIPADGRPRRVDPRMQLWMGYSRGTWDGDTLVVEVTNLNGRNWLDQVGNFFSSQARVVERFARVAPDMLDYQATIDDPAVFTRPWTIRLPLRRAAADPGDRYADEMWEHACHEGNKATGHVRDLGYQWYTGVTPPPPPAR